MTPPAAVTGRVAELVVRMDQVERTAQANHTWINGNGVDGAKQTLVKLEMRMCKLEGQLHSIFAVLMALAIPIILGVGGLLWALLTHQLELIVH